MKQKQKLAKRKRKADDDFPAFRTVTEKIIVNAEKIGELFAGELVDREERSCAADTIERHADDMLLAGMVDGAATVTVDLFLRGIIQTPARELERWRRYLKANSALIEAYREIARIHVLSGTILSILGALNWADSSKAISMGKVAELANGCCDALDAQDEKNRKRCCFIRETIEILVRLLDEHVGGYDSVCDTFRILRQPVDS